MLGSRDPRGAVGCAAAGILYRTTGGTVVLYACAGEQPRAHSGPEPIGWTRGGIDSTTYSCNASLDDFLASHKPLTGLGQCTQVLENPTLSSMFIIAALSWKEQAAEAAPGSIRGSVRGITVV